MLGINSQLLNKVKSENSDNKLREVMRIWLNIVDPPPSWSAIVEALRLLGEETLATQLRFKYCSGKIL